MPGHSFSLRGRGFALLCVVACTACTAVFALVLPQRADAHTSLRSTTPAPDSTLGKLPGAVTLTFTSKVRSGSGSIEVFDSSGQRIDQGNPRLTHGGTVTTQRLREGASGAIAVGWRVISADGHTVTGSFTFTVGNTTGNGATTQQSTKDRLSAATRKDRTALAVDGVGRFVALLSLLLATGGALFAASIAPGWKPRLLGATLASAVTGLVLTYMSDAAITSGSRFGGVFRVHTLVIEAGNPYGHAAIITGSMCLLAAIVATLLRTTPVAAVPAGPARATVALVFCTLAVTTSLAGHAAVTSPVAVRLPLDMLHVLAAAMWLGGLVQLGFLATSWIEGTPASPATSAARERQLGWVQRFSNVAFGCVVVLLITGTYATIAEVGMSWHGLTTTRYGHIILAKLLLYAGTIPLALLNRSTLVPALRARPRDASAMLRQYAVRETAILVVIVGLTAWLIGSDPHV